MENNLLFVTKQRILDELNDSIQHHPLYKDKVKAYHKLHLGKERPQEGVLLRNASANRIQLSPDDYAAEFESIVSICPVGCHENTSVEWVWEDLTHMTLYKEREDVTASLDSLTRRIVTVANGPIVAGRSNPELADNFAQIRLYIDGQRDLAAGVEGKDGKIILQNPLPSGATVEVDYWYRNIDDPGFYFLEITEIDKFIITPMLTIDDEVVIDATTGTETSASLDHSDVLTQGVVILYTQKTSLSVKLYLEKDVDYTIAIDGSVAFLAPLPADSTLYATYRYQGADRGPFSINQENYLDNTAIKGVTLAFGSRVVVGDKQAIALTHTREHVGKIYSGHWEMSFDISSFTRDPQSSAELTDHLIMDMWGRKRESLKSEGYTLEAMEPGGESEESYDDSTGAIYFTHSVSLQMITEWKKFVPYCVDLSSFNIDLHRFPELTSSELLEGGFLKDKELRPDQSFEVVYPKTGYPRNF